MEQFQVRTDLALEARERYEEDVEIRGVSVEETYDEKRDIRATTVRIESENGAKAMGKPIGVYITPVSYTHLDVYKRQEGKDGENGIQLENCFFIHAAFYSPVSGRLPGYSCAV